MIKEDVFPVIVFSFSRRECEEYAKYVAKLNFNTPEEAEQVREVYNAALLNLSEEDRQLAVRDSTATRGWNRNSPQRFAPGVKRID